jgi:hypothetical protein
LQESSLPVRSNDDQNRRPGGSPQLNRTVNVAALQIVWSLRINSNLPDGGLAFWHFPVVSVNDGPYYGRT